MVAGTLLLAVGLVAGAAHATDGVVEINQAKAMAGGVTPGDAPGFPVTITVGGSYRLTSNLDIVATGVMFQENIDGIVIDSLQDPREIEIDFNGFTLRGPVTCTFGANLTCTLNQSGTGIGIRMNSSAQIRIHDGAIEGFAGIGIYLNNNDVGGNQLRNLNLRWNHHGIVAAIAILENITATQNRGRGIDATRSVLSRIVSDVNGGHGIQVWDSTIDNCSSGFNGGDGISAVGSSIVRGCLLVQNQQWGLRCSGGTSGYSGNTINNNMAGTVQGAAQLGSNLCDEDLTCP